MSRLIDRGAIAAAYVGIGMALTIVASFTLIIPIEWLIWLLALPAGLLIGYYANQRSDRRAGPWSRILSNGLFAGVATGISVAALLLLIKVIFFFADSGYPDFNRVDEQNRPIPPTCATGADCVYQRYLAAGRGSDLDAVGVHDADAFTGFYWSEQLSSAGAIVILTLVGAAGGAGLYGLSRPRRSAPGSTAAAT